MEDSSGCHRTIIALAKVMVYKLIIQFKAPPNQQTLEKGSKRTSTMKPTVSLYTQHTSDHRPARLYDRTNRTHYRLRERHVA